MRSMLSNCVAKSKNKSSLTSSSMAKRKARARRLVHPRTKGAILGISSALIGFSSGSASSQTRSQKLSTKTSSSSSNKVQTVESASCHPAQLLIIVYTSKMESFRNKAFLDRTVIERKKRIFNLR